MIACRSLISFPCRVDSVWKYTNPFIKSNPTHQHFRICRFYNGFNCYQKIYGAKDMQSVMDRKKQKTVVTPVWRPVSTSSSSHDESLVTHAKAGSQSTRNFNSGGNTEVDSAEGRAPEGGSIPSTEKHVVSVEAGASLIRFIKGEGGSTQKTIEEELEVKIILPSSKKEESIRPSCVIYDEASSCSYGCIVWTSIEGNSADSITRASEKIKGIIDEAIKGPTLDYSHFVSLPLAIHPELVDKLVNFQSSILGLNDPNQCENLDSGSNEGSSDEEDKDLQLEGAPHVAVELKAGADNEQVKVAITNVPIVSYPPKASKSSTLEDLGIDKSIFIKPKTFHLTVLMLKLWNKDRVNAAAEVLQSVSSKVMAALDNRPVSIRLKGLMTMRGSLAKARVLYAPVEEVGGEDRLMRACQVIIDEFVKAGLVLEKDAEQKLKLHATVMNARHRKRKQRTRRADSFDARGIVKQYGSEEWGEYVIREAHLSQRFAFDEKGYYHCRASIPFPENMQLD
ncbi:hypothetical protein LguiB_023227 [Lonicera macranthoides]